jgi:hypothetical protein
MSRALTIPESLSQTRSRQQDGTATSTFTTFVLREERSRAMVIPAMFLSSGRSVHAMRETLAIPSGRCYQSKALMG